jgi:hypothetical protein
LSLEKYTRPTSWVYLFGVLLQLVVAGGGLTAAALIDTPIQLPSWIWILGALFVADGVALSVYYVRMRIALAPTEIWQLLYSCPRTRLRLPPRPVEDPLAFSCPRLCCLCLGEPNSTKPFGVAVSSTFMGVKTTTTAEFPICQDCFDLTHCSNGTQIVFGVGYALIGGGLLFLLRPGAELSSLGAVSLTMGTILAGWILLFAVAGVAHQRAPVKLVTADLLEVASPEYAAILAAANPSFEFVSPSAAN